MSEKEGGGAATIDPVMVMRIPTIISGCCVGMLGIMQVYCITMIIIVGIPDFFLRQLRHYENVHRREILLQILSFLIVATNIVFIFFASVHCPSVLLVEDKVIKFTRTRFASMHC